MATPPLPPGKTSYLDDDSRHPWVFIERAHIPVDNWPRRSPRPRLFSDVLDNNDLDALQETLQNKRDKYDILDSYLGLDAVRYCIYLRDTQPAGMVLACLSDMASHDPDEGRREQARRALRGAARAALEVDDPVWVAAAVNGLAMSQGCNFIRSSMDAAARSDHPVQQTQLIVDDFIKRELGGLRPLHAKSVLEHPTMREFVDCAVVDVLLLSASMRLSERHLTAPIAFGHFTHGSCVVGELEQRLKHCDGWSDERVLCNEMVRIVRDREFSLATKVKALKIALDGKRLGESRRADGPAR